MFKSIPASNLVEIFPDVLGAGGNPLGLNTNVLDDSAVYPNYEYASETLVGEHYGLTSNEYNFAVTYFNGYEGATARPQSLFITKYNSADVAAKLIGASTAALTLEELKLITGTLSVTIDGVVKSGNIDLSAATSFSNAANLIGTALGLEAGDVDYNASIKAFYILSPNVGATSTISYATGTAAVKLLLTEANGAVVDNDTVADTALTAAARMTSYSANWATITHIGAAFDVDTWKEIAAWVTTQNGRYWYVPYALDPLAIIPNSAASFGRWLEETKQEGTTPIYGELVHAALACGYAASINFEETNGRTTMAFRSQAGISATVTDEATAEALTGNGYSFYGAWATANSRFVMFGNGAVSGSFNWVDNYLFQVFLNSQLQLAYMNMLVNYKSIPYNADGIAIHRAVAQDPIDQGINFGGIRAGVRLTNQQRDIINRAAGFDAAQQLYSKGWVLLIQLPSAQVRAARGPFTEILYYTDGSSVQKVQLNSINVQ